MEAKYLYILLLLSVALFLQPTNAGKLQFRSVSPVTTFFYLIRASFLRRGRALLLVSKSYHSFKRSVRNFFFHFGVVQIRCACAFKGCSQHLVFAYVDKFLAL